jgi:hypothetical protein
LNPRTFLVTSPTHEWNLERRDGGGGVFDGFDFVISVARLAIRRQRVVSRNRLAMKTLGVQLLFCLVACPAMNFLEWRLVRHLFS